MKTIFKYHLIITDKQLLHLPAGAKILCVKMQQGTLQLWAEVDIDATKIEDRKIMLVGTGNDITEIFYTYIGSVIDGRFVWHVFEVI